MDTENTLSKSPKKKSKYTLKAQAYYREKHFELKCLALAHYGLVCQCCQEWRVALLSIDHIKGGGLAHRRQLRLEKKNRNPYDWYFKHNYPEGFQTLCHNCNQAKGRNGGVCPHKLERNAAMSGQMEEPLEVQSTTYIP